MRAQIYLRAYHITRYSINSAKIRDSFALEIAQSNSPHPIHLAVQELSHSGTRRRGAGAAVSQRGCGGLRCAALLVPCGTPPCTAVRPCATRRGPEAHSARPQRQHCKPCSSKFLLQNYVCLFAPLHLQPMHPSSTCRCPAALVSAAASAAAPAPARPPPRPGPPTSSAAAAAPFLGPAGRPSPRPAGDDGAGRGVPGYAQGAHSGRA
jgi:hypothetical protein